MQTARPTPDLPPADPPATSHPRDISARLAGAGALTFAAIVALQNVVRGGTAPATDATPAEVLAEVGDHRAVTFVLGASFVVSAAALMVFLGGAMPRLRSGSRPGWARTGFVAAGGVLALFSVTLAVDQALSVLAHGDHADLAAVQALWALHNSVFTILFAFIGGALLGLGRAGVAAGITPRAFEWLAPLGAAGLGLASMAGPAIAAGEAMPAFGVGGLGFLTWLAFLVTTGLRLVRSER